ncbi:saccharopine dehydrogenase NADP-binding domain-containing protein [Amorphus sp. 3PC139-8]|uniref:saccharopine dehydrogenase family protein n=1 Tax=Amorphus sp. 3PC139-8 TaxID=2735676 RepID=UPI00345C7111
MKKNVLIIGAGGVAQVVAHKCAQNNDVLGDIHIASRTVEKGEAIVSSVAETDALKVPGAIEAHQLDAMDVSATVDLIDRTDSSIVINVGTTYINMSVLSACIESGAAYIDTAIHEDPLKAQEGAPWYENYEWKRRKECDAAGVTAVLGVGFDPGVVNAYAALARDDYFDTIDTIDIIDVNAGSHSHYFATNFDPEINFREFTSEVLTWQNNEWVSNEMFEVRHDWNLPVVGRQPTYLCGHDEIHSLSQRLDVPTVRFWMGFGEHYINVFTVLNNLGLLSEQPVTTAEGQEVVPLKVVKAVLPDPASLAPTYTGKTCIGDLVKGTKNGNPREVFLYNVADHSDAFEEVGSQGISYTAGVPPVAAAMLIADGTWDVGRMANVEDLPPKPFLSVLGKIGLPTWIREGNRQEPLFA